ncbi:MAG: hypothetical protein K0S86_514 [Geminicoccaceae bacterium]|jgi:hypothetical protein|nr:hypothetical protein [Geminicoccaceae bacterium]
MSTKDWDSELKKIDRMLEGASDEALLPAKTAPTPEAKAEAVAKQKGTSTLGVMARLVLAVSLGVGMLFWPYEARCGLGLAAYLASVAVVVGAGVWTSIWTWRHRSSRAHILSLLLILWGGVLAAIEILPRAGYAKPDPVRTTWACP